MYIKGSFTVQVRYVVVYGFTESGMPELVCNTSSVRNASETCVQLNTALGSQRVKMTGTIVVLPTINHRHLFYFTVTFLSEGAKTQTTRDSHYRGRPHHHD